MAVIFRDDFSGSGNLVGRTPDGVNGGVYAYDTYFNSYGSSTGATISSGAVRYYTADCPAYAPLTGSPQDIYVEFRLLTGRVPVNIGARRQSGTGKAILVQCYESGPNYEYLNVQEYTQGTTRINHSDGSYIDNDTLSLGGAANYARTPHTIRMEMRGADVVVTLDGAVVCKYGVADVFGGGLYVEGFNPPGVYTSVFDYIEVGTLEPLAPFWINHTGTREAD